MGYALLPLIAYLVPEWNKLLLTLSVPLILIIGIAFVIPESPRWQIVNNKMTKAQKTLEKISQKNKKSLPKDFALQAVTEEESGDEAKFWHLFTNANMLKKTLIQYFVWFSCSVVYYGLTLSGATLFPDGNLYLTFLIGALVEFPAYALTIIFIFYFGRRGPLSFVFLMGGVAMFMMLAFLDSKF